MFQEICTLWSFEVKSYWRRTIQLLRVWQKSYTLLHLREHVIMQKHSAAYTVTSNSYFGDWKKTKETCWWRRIQLLTLWQEICSYCRKAIHLHAMCQGIHPKLLHWMQSIMVSPCLADGRTLKESCWWKTIQLLTMWQEICRNERHPMVIS